MAMCLMTKAQFEAELNKRKFIKTDKKTPQGDHTLWLYQPTNKHYSIPELDGEIPDSILEHYLRAVGALYNNHQGIESGDKQFCVTHAGDATEIKTASKPSLVKSSS